MLETLQRASGSNFRSQNRHGYNEPVANPTQSLRSLPSVDEVLRRTAIRKLLSSYARNLVVQTIQGRLDELRSLVLANDLEESELAGNLQHLDDWVSIRLRECLLPSLRKVVNATGVIVHTNLGRAPIAAPVATRVAEIARSYSTLEYDLEKGDRGHRDHHFEQRMVQLLGCEAATVCNNNAAAVFLLVNTLASGKKVLVSRGELIEIGGSFRIPDILRSSGAILKEVGTTNKTRISDYRRAIDEDTALILRVHPSNYRVVGFTARPRLEDLVQLAHETDLRLIKDVGSGCLFPVSHPALSREPTVQSVLEKGVGAVCFSGDKLLGGPQSGVVVGKREVVDRVRRNPLMRVCRVDKMTYAALESTLVEYQKGRASQIIPVWSLLSASVEEVERRARQMQAELDSLVFETRLRRGYSVIGGGAAPEERIATCLLAIRWPDHTTRELEQALRSRKIPILTRIEKDEVLMDLRTVLPEEQGTVVAAFSALKRMEKNQNPTQTGGGTN